MLHVTHQSPAGRVTDDGLGGAVLSLVFEEEHGLEVHVGPRVPGFVPVISNGALYIINLSGGNRDRQTRGSNQLKRYVTRWNRAPWPRRNSAKRPAPTSR